MLQFEVLIVELSAIHALPSLAVTLGEVAGLHHEVLHHAVEVNSLVVQRLGKVQLHNDGQSSPEKSAKKVLRPISLTDILYFSELFLVGGFAETLLPSAESPEVLHGLGANVGEQLHHDTAHRDPAD